jgi:hypothetical protein
VLVTGRWRPRGEDRAGRRPPASGELASSGRKEFAGVCELSVKAAGTGEDGLVERASRLFPAGRSRGVTVAVDGFFAFVWFGWGQAAAPSWLVIPLAVGTALGALLAATGVVVARRSAGRLPAMTDPAFRRRYSVIVGLEFGLLGAGAAVLGVAGHPVGSGLAGGEAWTWANARFMRQEGDGVGQGSWAGRFS